MHEPLQQITASSLAHLEEAARRYGGNLFMVEDWLARRGIDAETARMFRLGCVGFDPAPGHERMEGWLAIPYLGISKAGEEQVWTMRFRCIQDHDCKEHKHGKYQTLSGDPSRMYNVRAVKLAGQDISVCEGEMDAIILTKAGFPAVAMPGATSWRRHHARMLDGFQRVFIWGDPDDAGRKFSNEVAKTLGRSARIVHLKDGDVNETFLSGGREALEELIEEAV